jgi:uncharacterized protein
MSIEKTSEWRLRRGNTFWRRAIGALFLILLLVVLALGAIGWIASDRALSPDFRESAWSLDDYPELAPEDITFDSETGVTLEGRFFAGMNDATVILLHGFSERQDQVLPQAAILNNAGFNVFTYDGRHPDRYGDGVYSTLGALERFDLVSAVDYLQERTDVNPDRIGVYGASLGGATAILGGGMDDRLQAVAAEGAFSDGDSVIASSFERYIGLPSFPFGPVTKRVAEWRADARLDDARPVDAIALITDRPVLLIHGLEDDAVPPDHSERNLAAGDENVDVWWIEGAHHFDAHSVIPDEYAERLIAFFDSALHQ